MAKRYKVLVGIQNDKLKRRHEPGAVVELNEPEWDVKGLLAIGAVEADTKDPSAQPGVIFTAEQKAAIESLAKPGSN